MIVDDDEDDKDFLVEALTAIDPRIQYQWYGDGVNALNRLTEEGNEPPDCIFVDLKMPKVSGYQWLQLLRLLERYQQVPVVIYSGSRMYCDYYDLSRLGPVFFLCKHARMAELIQDVKGIIQADPSLIINH